MTTYRDRLPLGHPDYVGLPFHGLVTNEVLTLPNDEELAVPFEGHQTVLVRAADAEVPTFTPEQESFNESRGYTWQDFALLSGAFRWIGGQRLGAQSYLYHDGDHAWVIDVELSGEDLELTLAVYLRQLFGYLDDAHQPPTMSARRKLDELSFTPVRTGGTDQTAEMALYDRYVFMTHSQTGSVTAVNVAVSRAEEDYLDFGTGFAYQFGGNGYVVHNALEIQLSGKGLLTGTIGSGISGAITLLANAQEMHSSVDESTGTPFAGFRDGVSLSACQTDFSFDVPACTGSTQYYDGIDTREACWVDDGANPVGDSETSGSVITRTGSRHYVAVTKTGSITWLETIVDTTTTWSTSETASGSLTRIDHWQMTAFPSCSQSYTTEWSGFNAWSKEAIQSYVGNYSVVFGDSEYTQTVSNGTHSIEEWYEDDAHAVSGFATKVTNITAINDETPEYVTSCGSSGYLAKTCSAYFGDYWSCGAMGGVGGLTMIEPQVFRITVSAQCAGGLPEYAYVTIACNGESITTYTAGDWRVFDRGDVCRCRVVDLTCTAFVL